MRFPGSQLRFSSGAPCPFVRRRSRDAGKVLTIIRQWRIDLLR